MLLNYTNQTQGQHECLNCCPLSAHCLDQTRPSDPTIPSPSAPDGPQWHDIPAQHRSTHSRSWIWNMAGRGGSGAVCCLFSRSTSLPVTFVLYIYVYTLLTTTQRRNRRPTSRLPPHRHRPRIRHRARRRRRHQEIRHPPLRPLHHHQALEQRPPSGRRSRRARRLPL